MGGEFASMDIQRSSVGDSDLDKLGRELYVGGPDVECACTQTGDEDRAPGAGHRPSVGQAWCGRCSRPR